MYFRLIVKQAGQFVFRTSKISSVAVALEVRNALQQSAPYEVEVLQVTGSHVGKILSDAELVALQLPGAVFDEDSDGK